MAWQEIPESVNNVLEFVPNRYNYRLKAEYGRLYYWIKDSGMNKVAKLQHTSSSEDLYEEHD